MRTWPDKASRNTEASHGRGTERPPRRRAARAACREPKLAAGFFAFRRRRKHSEHNSDVEDTETDQPTLKAPQALSKYFFAAQVRSRSTINVSTHYEPRILNITDFDAFSSEIMQTRLIMGTDIYRRAWGGKKVLTKAPACLPHLEPLCTQFFGRSYRLSSLLCPSLHPCSVHFEHHAEELRNDFQQNITICNNLTQHRV